MKDEITKVQSLIANNNKLDTIPSLVELKHAKIIDAAELTTVPAFKTQISISRTIRK